MTSNILKRPVQIVASLCLILVISGCGYSGGSYRNNYWGAAELHLISPITVAAGSSYAYVTAPGRVVNRQDISTYELYCKISVPRAKTSGELVIKPDVFRIDHIYRRGPYAFNSPFDYRLAHSNQFSGFFNHESSKQDMELYFDLQSDIQPMIKSMSCIRFSDPYLENVPTVPEVREVFRGLAEFNS